MELPNYVCFSFWHNVWREMLLTFHSNNNFHKEIFINKKSCFNKVNYAFTRIKYTMQI